MKKFVFAFIGIVACATAFAAVDLDEELRERIKPAGKVCLQGQDCAAAPVATAAASGGSARSGEEVYKAACFTCHDSGLAGAPKLDDKAAWETRLEQGIETVYDHAINGIRGMPAMGACVNCSEQEIKNSVDYMLEQSGAM